MLGFFSAAVAVNHGRHRTHERRIVLSHG